MLTIKELKLHNFLSHKLTVVKFQPEQKTLIDGKSGAGKSSLFDAIIWGFYGKARSDNRWLIKQGAKSATVSLTLVQDQTEYKIERSISGNGRQSLSLEERSDPSQPFQQTKIAGLKNIQEHIEKNILHSSYLLFINSIAYLQDNKENFVKQTAAKRKDILLEIINADTYDQYYEWAKALTADHKVKLGICEGQTNQLKEDQAELQISAQDLPQKIVLYEKSKDKLAKLKADLADNQAKIQNLNLKISQGTEWQAEIDRLSQRIKAVQADIADKEQILIELHALDNPANQTQVEQLASKKQELDRLRSIVAAREIWNQKMMKLLATQPTSRDFDRQIDDVNQQIIRLMKNKIEQCPELEKVCPLLEKEQQKQISRLSEQIENIKEEQTEYTRDLEKYYRLKDDLGECPVVDMALLEEKEQTYNTILELSIHLKSAQEKIVLYNREITQQQLALASDQANCRDLQVKLDSLQNEFKQLEQCQTEGTQLSNKILIEESALEEALAHKITAEKAAQAIKKVKNDIDQLTKEQKLLNRQVEALELMKVIFGQNGLKAMVIDYIIPRFEQKINEILGKLSDFRIKLDTQKSTVKGESTIEGLFINIYNERGEEFDFDNYSGGERLKIIVAISEALAEIQKIGFRILDELFIGLDEESTANFAEVITTLQERFKQLFCISHLRNIKDMFDDKITVTKQNGTSIINI